MVILESVRQKAGEDMLDVARAVQCSSVQSTTLASSPPLPRSEVTSHSLGLSHLQ
jgi:hypothetical protein